MKKMGEFLSDDTKGYLCCESVSSEANIRITHRRYVKKVIKDIFKFLAICVVSAFLMCAAVLFIVLSAWMP